MSYETRTFLGWLVIIIIVLAYIAIRTGGFKRFTINPVIELGDGSRAKLWSFVGGLMILALLVLLFVAVLSYFGDNYQRPYIPGAHGVGGP
jgi:hypothetical membrane protein